MDPLSWSNWNLEMLVFVEGGKPENPGKSRRQQQQTQRQARVQLGPQWREASVRTVVAPLLLSTYIAL